MYRSVLAGQEWMTANRLHLGTDTRADELLVGCIIGIVYARGWLPAAGWFRGFWCLLTLASVALYASLIIDVAHPAQAAIWFRYDLVALAGGAILVGVLTFPATWVRALGWKPLRWTGRISYGLYLWNFPVCYIVTKSSWPFAVNVTVQVLVTFVAAVTSYYLVEAPCLRLKDRIRFHPPVD